MRQRKSRRAPRRPFRSLVLEQLECRQLLSAVSLNVLSVKLGVKGGYLTNYGEWIDARGQDVPLDENGDDIPGDGHTPVEAKDVTSITIAKGAPIDLRGVTKSSFPSIHQVTVTSASVGAEIHGSEYDDVFTLPCSGNELTMHWSAGGGNDTFRQVDEQGQICITLTTGDGDFSLSGTTTDFLWHRFNSSDSGEISFGNSGPFNRMIYSGVNSINDQVEAGFRLIDLGQGDNTAALTINESTSKVDGMVPFTFQTPSVEFTLRGGAGNDELAVAVAEEFAPPSLIVRGDEGDDLIDASASTASLILQGDDDDDRLRAGMGDDQLDGGFGKDVFIFFEGWGFDEVSGDNDDTIDMSGVATDLHFYVGTGEDTPANPVDSPAIFVADRHGNLIRNSGGDIGELVGGPADDEFLIRENRSLAFGTGRIDGGEGNNRLSFSSWQQSVVVELAMPPEGGRGAQGRASRPTDSGISTLFGIDRVATVFGGKGDDTLTGDAGPNLLDGGPGNDLYIVEDGWGIDVIEDPQGEDEIEFATQESVTLVLQSPAGEDAPSFVATAGDSQLSVFAKPQVLLLGTGDDVVRMQDGMTFEGRIYDEGGTDTLDYSAYTTSVAVDLAAGVETEDGDQLIYGLANGNVTLFDIENVIGGAEDDDLKGSAGDNRLSGGPGDDAHWRPPV